MTKEWMLHSQMSEDHDDGNSAVIPVPMKHGYQSGSIELDPYRYYHNMNENYLMWVGAGRGGTIDESATTEFLLPGKLW